MMKAGIGSQHNSLVLPIWVGNRCGLNGIGVNHYK